MSFETYEKTRPWAKAIKAAVATRKMPPWFAEPGVGHFKNDRTLRAEEIATLVAWADGGAKAGEASADRLTTSYTEGWSIGTPDVVFEMPQAFRVPAKGQVDYQYVVLPTHFKEDKWVTAIEARPGNRQLVHHIIAFIREPGSGYFEGAEHGVIFTPDQLPKPKKEPEASRGNLFPIEYLMGYAPGTPPERFEPGQAKLIKAGSELILQLHYTANGTVGEDRSKIGLIFAKEPPAERVLTMTAIHTDFKIPPGADNYQVDAELAVHSDVRLMSLFPHMHQRGKRFAMRLAQPDGAKQDLLKINWDFNWQLIYELAEPIALKAGSRIQATAWYDNSANNKFNPDPTKTVEWGDQSWEEMMIGFFNVAFDAKKDPAEVWGRAKPATAGGQ